MDASELWQRIRREAATEAASTPQLAHHLNQRVLRHATLAAALADLLANQLLRFDPALDAFEVEFLVLIHNSAIDEAAAADISKIASSNPACPNPLSAFLSFRGVQAVQLHRIAHQYWGQGRTTLAVLLQNWGAQIYGVDIHPAARLGRGLFVDHAIGLVVGETAVIEDNVAIWHGVTLGSTFAESGDRHPKIRRGATIAAGATILGNIEIGAGAVIAAGSVVLRSIPAGMLAAGAPARVVKPAAGAYAAISLQPPAVLEAP